MEQAPNLIPDNESLSGLDGLIAKLLPKSANEEDRAALMRSASDFNYRSKLVGRLYSYKQSLSRDILNSVVENFSNSFSNLDLQKFYGFIKIAAGKAQGSHLFSQRYDLLSQQLQNIEINSRAELEFVQRLVGNINKWDRNSARTVEARERFDAVYRQKIGEFTLASTSENSVVDRTPSIESLPVADQTPNLFSRISSYFSNLGKEIYNNYLKPLVEGSSFSLPQRFVTASLASILTLSSLGMTFHSTSAYAGSNGSGQAVVERMDSTSSSPATADGGTAASGSAAGDGPDPKNVYIFSGKLKKDQFLSHILSDCFPGSNIDYKQGRFNPDTGLGFDLKGDFEYAKKIIVEHSPDITDADKIRYDHDHVNILDNLVRLIKLRKAADAGHETRDPEPTQPGSDQSQLAGDVNQGSGEGQPSRSIRSHTGPYESDDSTNYTQFPVQNKNRNLPPRPDLSQSLPHGFELSQNGTLLYLGTPYDTLAANFGESISPAKSDDPGQGSSKLSLRGLMSRLSAALNSGSPNFGGPKHDPANCPETTSYGNNEFNVINQGGKLSIEFTNTTYTPKQMETLLGMNLSVSHSGYINDQVIKSSTGGLEGNLSMWQDSAQVPGSIILDNCDNGRIDVVWAPVIKRQDGFDFLEYAAFTNGPNGLSPVTIRSSVESRLLFDRTARDGFYLAPSSQVIFQQK